MLGDALFHEETGELEVTVEALDDGHAAGEAGGGGGIRMGDFFGGGNQGLIPAGTELERSVRRIMRDEARKNGTPGIMKRF